MLLERPGAAVEVEKAPVMAAKSASEQKETLKIDTEADDNFSDSPTLDSETVASSPVSRKTAEAFEVDFGGTAMPDKSNTCLQEAFQKFRKQRQDDIRQTRKIKKRIRTDPKRMERLRHKFVEQAKKYFGVPYARKYWAKDTPEYNSPIFLDCCGLVRQVMRDLEADFGFRIGPWNQAYMFDTLPIRLTEDTMRAGDLVFMSGTYTNPKNKKQRHNMTHVEIWAGDGKKTIGARWNNGKVKVHDSYMFSPKSFINEQYYFRSIDTWLMGVCKSHCERHRWGTSNYNPGKKSIFFPQQQSLTMQDQKAGDEDESDSENSARRQSASPSQESSGTSAQEEKKSESAESAEKDERQGSPTAPRKKKKKKVKKVSKSKILPQSTKAALMELEDRIDDLVAKKGDVFGSSRPQCPLKSSRGMKGRVLQRPATSLDALGAGGDQKPLTARSLSSTTVKVPLVGDCNAEPMQYVPTMMPRRQNVPLVTRRSGAPVGELPTTYTPRRQPWMDVSPRAGTADPRSCLTESLPGRGMLTVIGSGAQKGDGLKKNKSCNDLDSESHRAPPKTAAPPGKTWRHSAPENLSGLSFSVEFVERVREMTPTTPSVEATYSSYDADDVIDSGSDDGETSVACVSDCCSSDMEDGCERDLATCIVLQHDTDDELDILASSTSCPEFYGARSQAFVNAEEEEAGEEDDGRENDDFSAAPAALSFAYRSEWRVSESQYQYEGPSPSVCSVSPPSSSKQTTPRRPRSFLLPPDNIFEDVLQNSSTSEESSCTSLVQDSDSDVYNTRATRSSSDQYLYKVPSEPCVTTSAFTASSGTNRHSAPNVTQQISESNKMIRPKSMTQTKSLQVTERKTAGSKSTTKIKPLQEAEKTTGESKYTFQAVPEDGNEDKKGGQNGGQGAGSGSGGEPSESEQGGGDEAGGDGAGGDGRSGRKGGKKTPGGAGRPTKLPSCSLPSNMTPTFYVGGGNGVSLVEGPLLALGWKRTLDKYDERYRLKWVECKSRINYAAFKEGDQLVNHIPNCKLLTNKLGLLCSLQEYERVTLSTKGRFPRLRMSDFVPETYKLDERNDRTTFLNTYKDGEIWICKPVGMNQGKGIFLLRSREEIDNLLAERDAKRETNKHSTRPPMTRIVQRYILNPLLLEGRKFDIRAYMLIASTVPFLVLFHHGYIRLSCLKYDGNDTNLTTHLTNQFVQKKDPAYKDVKEDTAWSMDKFNDYVNRHFAEEKGIEQDWTYGTLTRQMQKIMLHLFNSVKHKLQCKIGYFALYGLDFMIDTDMKVWLIEVNVNPALHINCEALKEVIPGVVEETLHLSIECFDKARKNQALLPLQSMKGFKILHCGTAPFNVAPRQTRSVSPAKGPENSERQRQAQTAHTRHYSPPRSLPRMSLTTTQVAYQGSNAQTSTSSTKTSQTGPLPTIVRSSTSQASSSSTVTASSSTSIDNKRTTTTTVPASTTDSNKNVSGGSGGDGNTGEDVKLKMTHANSTVLRKTRDKPDRGN